MTKVKKAKKKNLKLRRQIRKTAGALLMISAIVVAAIPVQPLEAESLKADDTELVDTRAAINYDPRLIEEGYVLSDGADYDSGDMSQKKAAKYAADINRNSNITNSSAIVADNIKKSLFVKNLNGSWIMDWQFKYYEIPKGANGTVICGYNSTYLSELVSVPTFVTTGYWYTTREDYEKWFEDEKDGKAASHTVTYSDYAAYRDTGVADANIRWFLSYSPTAFNPFSAYYALSPAQQATTPMPGNVTVNPNTDFSEEEKENFYCQVQLKLPNQYGPYTLETVRILDDGTGSGTVRDVLMAKAQKPFDRTDQEGFYEDSDAVAPILAIADRTFYGVGNVGQLTVGGNIKYIGKEAFANSSISGIDIQNVESIGGRAFKNCYNLSTVKIESPTKSIGAECFYQTNISEIVMPGGLEQIGYGAFAFCQRLSKVDFTKISNDCVIDDYAFFEDVALQEVTMLGSSIRGMGEGVFALTSSPMGGWTEAVLPERMVDQSGKNPQTKNGDLFAELGELGDLLFAGRTNLLSVKFPFQYGGSSKVYVPSGMFKGCINLAYVDFNMGKGSVQNAYADYEQDHPVPVVDKNRNSNTEKGSDYCLLFLDVINPEFEVHGPEANSARETALPRRSTWQAITRVSNVVPYMYIDTNGNECYEVSNGTYLWQVKKIGEEGGVKFGELSSCKLVEGADPDKIDPVLVIPGKVGTYQIKQIGNGCFSDEDTRNTIEQIIIEDNSIEKLDDAVFEGLPKLTKVDIGNSVTSIGARAFANCTKLVDVTFRAEKVTIGVDAFKTESEKLTFHGKIEPGYEPFEFAMGDLGKIDEHGKRICYKSLSPNFLTVMRDNATNEITLLDYPKYAKLDENNADYCKSMESYYYRVYGSDNHEHDRERDEFKTKWQEIKAAGDDAAIEPPSTIEALYESNYYGPWIDKKFVDANKGDLGDDLKAFYDKYPYSVLENYERADRRGDFETPTEEELAWVDACQNIVVPAGVTSIDAPAFFRATDNARNVAAYFGVGSEGYESRIMCTDKQNVSGAVPGLFSGVIKDYEDGDPEAEVFEKKVQGNDRILSVTLTDVKALPDYAFDSCERLEKVDIGPACESMGKAPFRGCDVIDKVTGNDKFIADNRIIYTVNADETYTIKECLPSRGNNGSSSLISSETDPNIKKVSSIEAGAFEDCDYISRVFLEDTNQLKVIPKDCFKNCDKLREVKLPITVNRIEGGAFKEIELVTVRIPGKEVHIVSDAFEHGSEGGATIATYPNTSAYDYAEYYDINIEIIEEGFEVRFFDWDGTELREPQYVEEGRSAEPPEKEPTREGFTFKGWSHDYTNVQSDLTIIAVYDDNSGDASRHKVTFFDRDGKELDTQMVSHGDRARAPIPPEVPGYDFIGWRPADFSKVEKDMEIWAYYEPATNVSPSPGTSASPGGSGDPNATKDPNATSKPTGTPGATPTATPLNGDGRVRYTVTVSGGSGSGTYPAGAIVAINAYFMGEGQVFDRWTSSTAGVGFADPNAASTTFTMPAANVAITATYKPGGASSTTGGTGGGRGNGSSSNGTTSNNGTRVEVDRPGISNTDVAGATVNGATDNFVIKVTEDQAATDAVIAALQARYGDLSRIKYTAMDISLYDSTGRTKIADTTGISVNLTLPLPDELIQYAGNNKAAAVSNAQLEDLDVKFTTVDGVPCINFTATHFSPYVIYVDTANLTEGTTDMTPKTGDPIHPKWFLSLGMASIALILFFKRDKVVVQTKKA